MVALESENQVKEDQIQLVSGGYLLKSIVDVERTSPA